MKKTRIIIAGAALLLAVSAVGGTWAAWSATLIAKNEYKTAKYSTFLTEHFKEPERWAPGITERKEVAVTNDGTVPIVAQIKMKQHWYRAEDRTVETYEPSEDGGMVRREILLEKGTLDPVFTGDGGEEQYAAQWHFNGTRGEEVYVLESGRDPETPGLWFTYSDGTPLKTVREISEANGHWLLRSELPDRAGWFTFYYIGEIPAGEQSPKLLESVTMNPLLEATVTGKETFYVKDDEAEDGYRQVTAAAVSSKYGEEAGGYDGCEYALDITVKTAQATEGGLRYTYKEWDEITEYLSGYITGLGYDGSALPGMKRMWIVQKGNEISYVPTRDADGENMRDPGNWFMSFTNMVPGETYTDTLNIHNESLYNYKIYMRIVPKADGELDQDPELERLKRELLEKIHMEVYYLDPASADLAEELVAGGAENGTARMRGSLLYRGTSTGIFDGTGAREDGSGEGDGSGGEDGTDGQAMYASLRDLIPLGRYAKGSEGTVYVKLTLDPDIGLDSEEVKRSEDGRIIKPDYRYADLLTKVDWEFMIQLEPTLQSKYPPPEDIPDPGVPLADIQDSEVPLISIPDPNVPLAAVPATGDERPVVPAAVTLLAALALAVTFGTMICRERKDRRSEGAEDVRDR